MTDTTSRSYEIAVQNLQRQYASGQITKTHRDTALEKLANALNNGRASASPPTPVRTVDFENRLKDTYESLGKVQFRTSDFKRESGIANRDFVFPDKLHNGNLPYVKFDIFEINSNPAAQVTSTIANRSQASLQAGLQQGAKATYGAASILAEKAGELASNLVGKTITESVKSGVEAAGEIAATTAQQAGVNPEQLKQRIASLFEDFSLNRYSDTRISSVVLPIPEGLQTQYSQDYGELSLTSAFGKSGFLAQYLAEPEKLDRGDPYLTELAATGAQAIFNTSEELTNILTFGASGRVINPQMEMLYRSPQFREFVFDFRLIPRNEYDTRKVLNIIKELKIRSAPTFCGTTTGRYYVPPARFAFSFFNSNGRENEYLFRSKQCVVTNVSVDYAPNGYATHSDGSPVEIRLQLQLKETAMITAEDIVEDNY